MIDIATTSLWRITGNLNKVISYIENPDKTIGPTGKTDSSRARSIEDVIDYVSRENATNSRQWVRGINVKLETAKEEMLKTKRDAGKTGGTIAYHGYQSFSEGEVTPDQAHEIGVRLAEILWGDRFEVVVATHLDKQSHIHNHFVINTVSFVDGKKFHRTKDDYRRMQQVSDRLCKEYGLSVIRHPEDGKGRNYGEWSAEKNGKPTYRSMIRRDIDTAIKASLTDQDFFRVMEEMGYEFKLYTAKAEPLMRPSLKPKDSQRFFRFDRLGDDYDVDAIKSRIIENMHREVPFSEAERQKVAKYRQEHPPRPKARGIAALYYHYCYELHIIIQYPASVKRVSSYMRDDIRKLDQLDEQARLLGENSIETIDDLNRYREITRNDIDALTKAKKIYRKQLVEASGSGDQQTEETLTGKIKGIDDSLKKLRHSLKVADKVEERSADLEEMQKALDDLQKPQEQEKPEQTPARDSREHSDIIRRRW